jgi:hypothetical protein
MEKTIFIDITSQNMGQFKKHKIKLNPTRKQRVIIIVAFHSRLSVFHS